MLPVLILGNNPKQTCRPRSPPTAREFVMTTFSRIADRITTKREGHRRRPPNIMNTSNEAGGPMKRNVAIAQCSSDIGKTLPFLEPNLCSHLPLDGLITELESITVDLGVSTLLDTQAFAPIITPSAITMSFHSFAPGPIYTSSPMIGAPPLIGFAPILTPLLRVQLRPILAWRLMTMLP